MPIQTIANNCRRCGVKIAQTYDYCSYCYSYYSQEKDYEDIYTFVKGNIHFYDYVPHKYVFYKEKNEKPPFYLGFELEVEPCEVNPSFLLEIRNRYQLLTDIAQIIDSLPEFVYIKYDGSLIEGFEIVSHPLSYRWMLTHKHRINNLLTLLKKYGFISYITSTCGMHVHISKHAFTPFHFYKFQLFIYSNKKFIEAIAERDGDILKRWASLYYKKKKLIKKAKCDRRSDIERRDTKYTAVRISKPTTYEIRIFRGTLAEEVFWKNIEFVHSLYMFTLNKGLQELKVPIYLKWIKENKKDYLSLNEFLCDLEYK